MVDFGYIPNPHATERFVSNLRFPTGDKVPVFSLVNEQKDAYLWLGMAQFLPNYKRTFQTIGDCFSPDTLVFGPDNTRPIKDIEIGDRVYSGRGTITQVISKQVKVSCKPIVTIHTTGGLPLRVTSDHKVLAYRFDFKEAKTKKRITKALYKRSGSENGAVAVAYKSRRAEWVAAGNLKESDYLLTPLEIQQEALPNHALFSSPETRWVFGYFLGDGHASGGSVEFAVADEAIATRITKTLVSLGYKPKRAIYRKNCGAFRIRVHNRELVKWLRATCYCPEGLKLMPSWAIGDPDIGDGLIDADGSRDGDITRFDSISPSLAFGMQATLIQQGFDATLTVLQRSKGSYQNARTIYRVIARANRSRKKLWRDDQWLCRPVSKLEFSEGPHEVYDIGVTETSH